MPASWSRTWSHVELTGSAFVWIVLAIMGVLLCGSVGVVNFIGAYIPFLGAFIGGAFAVLMAISEGGLGLAAPLTSIGFDLFSELKSSGFFDDDLGDTLEPDELDVQRGSQPET